LSLHHGDESNTFYEATTFPSVTFLLRQCVKLTTHGRPVKIRHTTIRPDAFWQIKATMLKRSPSLTEQAKATIKERILDGRYEDGRIPSESDLATELGVSRTTIRDALSRLEFEGTVYRKQGAGTFVNRPSLQIKSRLEEIWSYEGTLEAHGYTPSVTILGLEKIQPWSSLQEALALLPGTEVTALRKLFSEDEEPVIFTENFIPSHFVGEKCETASLRLPIYEFLATCCQQNLSYYLSEIVPVLADEKLAEILHIEPATPLITFEEIGYNDENEPIVWARSYFRDDLLRFRFIRRTIS
jgi:GntR family transcriptional regulator